jgi:hypothetical protein
LLYQIAEAQDRLDRVDAVREQMVQKYLNLNASDQEAVRAGLMSDYLKLDARGREGWNRDVVAQNIIGPDLERLAAAAEFRDMNEQDQLRFRSAMLEKYRSLSRVEQQTWQTDPIVAVVLGKDWWVK